MTVQRQMKIAFIVTEFPALSETFVLNQITGLIGRGHEVDVIAQRPRAEDDRHADIDSYRLMERVHYSSPPASYISRLWGAVGILRKTRVQNMRQTLNALNIFRHGMDSLSLRLLYFSYACRGGPYDFVLCHSGPNGLLACQLRAKGIINGEIVTFFHGYDISGLLQNKSLSVYEHLFRQGDIFFPICNTWKRKLLQLGCNPERIWVHRMGIDLQKFSYQPRIWDGTGFFRVVSVARLVEKKGIAYGIRAVARLVEAQVPISYTIIGDGPLLAELQGLIDSLGVNSSVRLIGAKNQVDVRSIFLESHVLLAPSITSESGDQEGIPVVLMEAMATGLVVVSTEHSGIPELVESGVTGLLVQEKDYRGLADMLLALINEPQMLSRLSRAGAVAVSAQHDIAQLNNTLVDFLAGQKQRKV